MHHKDKQAYDLRCKAAAIDASRKTVTVELTLPTAWLLRDLIGLCNLSARIDSVGTAADLCSLNGALGFRPTAPRDQLPEPHVAGWAEAQINKLVSR